MTESLQLESISQSGALSLLDSGVLMLTSHSRLATDWRRRFVAASTSSVVSTPQIEGWQNWLAKLAADEPAIPVALRRLQELQLWERVISSDLRKSDQGNNLARGLAHHAASAYALMQEYQISAAELTGYGEEAEALQRWISAMQHEMNEHARSVAADLPRLLLPHLHKLCPGKQLLMGGFDVLTPMQKTVLQLLQKHGVQLLTVAAEQEAAQLTLTACDDPEAECRYVAERIAYAIAASPQARVAVVYSRRACDQKLLRRIVDERLLQAVMQPEKQAVNMAGQPLVEAPMIRQLFALLQLAGRSGAPFADFSRLLFSPGVKGFSDECLVRAELDAELRKKNRHYIGFKSLLASESMEGLPQLGSVLKSLLLWDRSPRPAGEWVRLLHSLLQDVGFLQPGVGARSSFEVRQLNGFRDCLTSLVAIDAVREKIEWHLFLGLLRTACSEAELPLTAQFPQVSVLPLDQVSGLKFDVVFAMGMDSDALPLSVDIAPLLPLALQRKYQMGRATAEQAYKASNSLWQQLKQAADELYISYACQHDEHHVTASSLCSDIAESAYVEKAHETERVEIELFDDAPSVPLFDGEKVRGGTAVIRSQSACPFRAFATHRLGVVPLDETSPGVDAAEKGSLIHKALEYIWGELRQQGKLLAMDEDDTSTLVAAAVSHAWQQSHGSISEVQRQFESQRMQRVLMVWLDEERQRPPFEVVEREAWHRMSLPQAGKNTFSINLQIDRIDHDSDGNQILIDYKTGQKQSIGKWIGERMSEPQLPLYSMAAEVSIGDAVCFARVRSGDMGFEGLSGEDTGIGGIAVYKGKDEEAETWLDLLKLWKKRINILASEFVEGRCDVSPRDASACDYCGLEALCRISEVGTADDSGGGEL